MTRFYAKANSNDLTLQDIVNLSNISLDEIYKDVANGSRTLQFDDPAYADDPYEAYNLVSGTARYAMSTDGNSANVLGIRKVLAADSSGNFTELHPMGLDDVEAQGFMKGTTPTGVPSRYLQFGENLILDATPNYNYTGGLKVFYKRSIKHFTSGDTTATPGFAEPFHELVPLINAQRWCLREGKQSTASSLEAKIREKKEDLKEFYSAQAKDNKGLQFTGIFRSSR